MPNAALECRELQNEIVSMRRTLHGIPETGFELPQTREFVTKKLGEYGIEYRLSGGDCGVVAYINKGKGGRCLALRSDMDALRIKEETGLPFASLNGCMHACGHDAHMAMLLGAAKVLNAHRDELNGEVRLLFQTAEEPAKGARVMIESGALEGVGAIFGTHIGTFIDKDIPAGNMIICKGPVMASYDKFTIRIIGTGCHGSTPESGVDPVNIAAHTVIALEALNAREFGACVPVVATIGMIRGGDQYNVIPGEVVMTGTTRSFDEAVRRRLAERIGEIAVRTAETFGGRAEFEMDWGGPAVINDADMAEFAAGCAAEVIGADRVITHRDHPTMVGEDFSEYLNLVPGAYMFLSSSNHEKGTDLPHHNSRFDIDEDVLWEGSAVFVNIAEKYLG